MQAVKRDGDNKKENIPNRQNALALWKTVGELRINIQKMILQQKESRETTKQACVKTR